MEAAEMMQCVCVFCRIDMALMTPELKRKCKHHPSPSPFPLSPVHHCPSLLCLLSTPGLVRLLDLQEWWLLPVSLKCMYTTR